MRPQSSNCNIILWYPLIWFGHPIYGLWIINSIWNILLTKTIFNLVKIIYGTGCSLGHETNSFPNCYQKIYLMRLEIRNSLSPLRILYLSVIVYFMDSTSRVYPITSPTSVIVPMTVTSWPVEKPDTVSMCSSDIIHITESNEYSSFRGPIEK